MDQKRLKDAFAKKRRSIFFTLSAIVILLCLTLISALTLRNSNFANLSFGKENNSIDFLNSQIEEKVAKYQKAELYDRTKINQEIRKIAQIRKNLLIREMKEEPDQLTSKAVFSDKAAVLPKSTQALFEKKVNLNGKLTISTKNENQSNPKEVDFLFETADLGQISTFPAYFSDKKPIKDVNIPVTISGLLIDDNLLINSIVIINTPSPTQYNLR